MENMDSLLALAKQVEKDIKAVSKAEYYGELDKLERKCLDGIRMLQMRAAQVHRDLFAVSQNRRNELANGIVENVEKHIEEIEEVMESDMAKIKKAKKATKKPAKKAKKKTAKKK